MKKMKNREILLDVIGDTDEKLIPELSPKRKPNRFLKWAAVGSVCAAAVIACVIVFPKAGKHKPSYIVSDKAMVLAKSGDMKCDFMNAYQMANYSWGDHFSSVSLLLQNNGHMKLILPREGYTPADLLSDKQVSKLLVSNGNYSKSKSPMITLSIPKFDVSSTINLSDGLNALGITDIFDAEKSDFTPLTDSTDEIYLSQAEQNTRVLID